MPFLQLTFEIGARDPQPFEDALFVAGAASVTLADAADNPILEPAPGATPLWPTVSVTALFTHDANREQIVRTVQTETNAALQTYSFDELADRAWEREWLKDFKPMRFGERLWICPGGMMPPAEDLSASSATQADRCLIELDPGLAFGTGTHPTTALCLEWLDSADIKGKAIIDYGCGSGILSIAALKLGASHAVGIDIDSQALTASRENARRNGVDVALQLQLANEPLTATPILLANILAGPLTELAETFAALVLPGGDIVLSGILREQAPALAHRYAKWFDMQPAAYRGERANEWVRLTGKRFRQ